MNEFPPPPPLFLRPLLFFFFLSLKYWNNIWFLWFLWLRWRMCISDDRFYQSIYSFWAHKHAVQHVNVSTNASVCLLCHSDGVRFRFPDTVYGRDPFNQNFRKLNSMDRFGPTGKVSKKLVHLLRWSFFLVWPVWILVEWISPYNSYSFCSSIHDAAFDGWLNFLQRNGE